MKYPCDKCQRADKEYCYKHKSCPAWVAWFGEQFYNAREIAYGRMEGKDEKLN